MATPTPHKNAASQQGRTPQFSAASPPVSTPFSLNQGQAAFSPRGPRSSPQQVKKSPATTTGLGGHVANGSLNFDSPSAAAAMGALGIGTGLDIGLDHVGGLGGLQGLGVMGGEDEKLKRLDAVIEILSHKKGYVSEEGLERLVQRIGLDCIWDTYTEVGIDGKHVGPKMPNLIIGGKALQLDITLDNHVVQHVALSFPLSVPVVTERAAKAGAILKKDLELNPGQSPLTKKLDKFWANLERLAILDKLSVIPGLDLQEALAGLCTSLQKIHEWDMEKLRAGPSTAGKGEKYMLNIATCSRHGHPVMHARDRVGLNLDYWIQRHLAPPKILATEKFVDKNEGTWSLLISCAPLGEMVYPPVRISDSWVSPRIEKEDPSAEDVLHTTTGPVLDWQEPESTVLPPTEENKVEDVGLSMNKYPEVIFKAFLEPAVILPQPVWLHMHQMIAIDPPQLYSYPTFDSLFFPIPPTEGHDPSAPRTLEQWRDVPFQPVDGDGNAGTKKHKNTLYIYKPVYGQVLTELPFSHPKQLINLLPTLRQYALLATLLRRSFSPRASPKTLGSSDQGSSAVPRKQELDTFSSSQSTTAPQNGGPTPDEDVTPVDVILTVHPAPRLQVVFPLRSTTANINIEIGPNGKVRIISQNILPDGENGMEESGKGKGKQFTPDDLGRVLEYFEDLDEWCQWIRTRLNRD